MSLENGTQLGPYEIVAPIDAGGMGDVYKARDTRLKRFVAIKTSREKFSERLEREMRVIASLSHPNVCALYDVGPNYLVMELLEGQTLQQTMASRRLSADEVVGIAQQMAEALHAAHAKGITHRDVKPGNVFVSPRGHVKVLDFGLAKVSAALFAGDEMQTTAADLSQPGSVMGTVTYMSPEQARGQELDGRSDLWSLGVVLYEMLTGVQPFKGPTSAVVFTAIFTQQPDLTGVSPKLRQLVARLLEKDRELRYQTAADLLADLKRAERSDESGNAGVTTDFALAPKRSWMFVMAAAVVLAIGAGVWYWPRQPNPPVTRQGKPVEQPVRNGNGQPVMDLTKLHITKEDRLVIADFVNKTGDTVFDGTLGEALAVKLEESNLVRPMSPGEVQDLLVLMRKDPASKLTPELATQVCIRAQEKAVLAGSITALGSRYALLLTVTNCMTNAVLATAQAQADGKEKVLDALSEGVDAMREKLGEQLTTAQRIGGHESMPLTTASLEAFQAYSMGLELFRKEKRAESNPYFRRAREIDPKFARAWSVEAATASSAGRAAEADDLMRKAYEHRQSASRIERLFVEASYAERIERDREKARKLYEELLQLAPHVGAAQNNLAGIYANMGNRVRSTELHEDLLLYHPDFALSYTTLTADYVAQGRFAEARRILAKAVAQKLALPSLHANLLMISYMEGDLAGAESESAAASQIDERQPLAIRANYAYAVGRLGEGDRLRLSTLPAGRAGNVVGSPVNLAARAFAEDCGGISPAVTVTNALLVCGERQRAAQTVEGNLDNPNLEPEVASRLRAIVALAHGQPQQAVDALRVAVRRDSPFTDDLMLIGLAYMDLKKPADATRELRKVTSRKSRLFDPYYPRAHVDLARALTAAGDKQGAKKVYEAFFKLWTEADQDLPLLSNAKTEYAALNPPQPSAK